MLPGLFFKYQEQLATRAKVRNQAQMGHSLHNANNQTIVILFDIDGIP